MDLDSSKVYVTPFIMGSLFDRKNLPGLVHGETELIVLRYRTDPKNIHRLLPDCYEPDEDPIVSMVFAEFGGVGFLAGNSCRQASVKISARYDGQEDRLSGDYVLLAFETETLSVIVGREHLGIPKIYGDVSAIKALDDGQRCCEVSLWGHLLFGIEVELLSVQPAAACRRTAESFSERPAFGYKYFQSLDGHIDAEYATVAWADFEVSQLRLGQTGRLYFGSASESDIAEYKSVVDAVKSLPVNQVIESVQMRGSMVLRYDKCRRLR